MRKRKTALTLLATRLFKFEVEATRLEPSQHASCRSIPGPLTSPWESGVHRSDTPRAMGPEQVDAIAIRAEVGRTEAGKSWFHLARPRHRIAHRNRSVQGERTTDH